MSTTAWNLGELKESVRSTRSDADSILTIIDSISRSDQIFVYHMATARDALKGIVDECNAQGIDNFLLIFRASERQDEFQYAKLVSEAHIIGCMHTARSLWDLFAQLVNALILEKPMSVGKCDINGVFNALSDSPLKAKLRLLLSSHWYDYVNAFINTTKHRQLVQHMMSVSIEDNRAGIRVGAFTYETKSFQAYWGTEVLEGAIEVKNVIIECGRLLSAAYVKKA